MFPLSVYCKWSAPTMVITITSAKSSVFLGFFSSTKPGKSLFYNKRWHMNAQIKDLGLTHSADFRQDDTLLGWVGHQFLLIYFQDWKYPLSLYVWSPPPNFVSNFCFFNTNLSVFLFLLIFSSLLFSYGNLSKPVRWQQEEFFFWASFFCRKLFV